MNLIIVTGTIATEPRPVHVEDDSHALAFDLDVTNDVDQLLTRFRVVLTRHEPPTLGVELRPNSFVSIEGRVVPTLGTNAINGIEIRTNRIAPLTPRLRTTNEDA